MWGGKERERFYSFILLHSAHTSFLTYRGTHRVFLCLPVSPCMPLGLYVSFCVSLCLRVSPCVSLCLYVSLCVSLCLPVSPCGIFVSKVACDLTVRTRNADVTVTTHEHLAISKVASPDDFYVLSGGCAG